jgi:hypothetical protein
MAFPPALPDVLAWSTLFRNYKTFGNYVSYVKVACECLGVSLEVRHLSGRGRRACSLGAWRVLAQVFAHPSVARAKDAIAKRCLSQTRVPLFVQMPMVQGMVVSLLRKHELRELVMLFLAAYVFLLRVPSEALPMAAGGGAGKKVTPIFKVHVDRNTVELWLPKRKNRRTPSSQFRLFVAPFLHGLFVAIACVSHRPCWCKKCPVTCPVHVLGAYMAGLPVGTQPFVGITPAAANKGLRSLLLCLDVPRAADYRCHDLRRGHAEDLRRGGATLGEILRAGDWRSPAFLQYLSAEQLEMDRVVEAYDLESSDEDN